eukprot:TRINITY_DN13736_c0_g1_i2.p1 TRINITY_DN13736_c0_g1~~TRINITY_DN13736_c0_g1_i2.p1  ORF type:complete len:135 (-),score=19.15 TRINITY_DN13736_c0_g1_i2:439-843(-)
MPVLSLNNTHAAVTAAGLVGPCHAVASEIMQCYRAEHPARCRSLFSKLEACHRQENDTCVAGVMGFAETKCPKETAELDKCLDYASDRRREEECRNEFMRALQCGSREFLADLEPQEKAWLGELVGHVRSGASA